MATGDYVDCRGIPYISKEQVLKKVEEKLGNTYHSPYNSWDAEDFPYLSVSTIRDTLSGYKDREELGKCVGTWEEFHNKLKFNIKEVN